MTSAAYKYVYAQWRADPEGFWQEVAADIDWIAAPPRAFDPQAGVYGRWFPGAVCNTCHNAVDRHVEAGRGEQIALIHDSPVTGTVSKISYAGLRREVSVLAAVLRRQGVARGDRVVIYMPMIPEAVYAMLACARIGAVHSVVFGGFAARELAARIDDADAKLVLSASCGIEGARTVEYKPLLDAALEMASSGRDVRCLVLQRPQCEAPLVRGRDFDWKAEVDAARSQDASADCEPVAATDPLYILYTSGTTGAPKGVVRDNGGHMVALHWSMKAIYGMSPGEVFWAASDIGWVVGHSYIVYGPLLAGCTTVLYEGKPVGTPDAGAFWRVVREHGVNVLFTAPTALRAIKREDPAGHLLRAAPMPSLRALFLAGERADPDTVEWAAGLLGVPVVDHWWQTETGWCIAGNPIGLEMLPVPVGSAGVPMPGYALEIVDEAGTPLPPGQMGTVAIRMPLPPGALTTLWRADLRFVNGYLTMFPGYYTTFDAGIIDDDGCVRVMGRTDDIINVAGHRLSTGAMEEVLASHPAVAECAVVGIADPLKGEVPCGLVVLKADASRPESEVESELVAIVRDRIGPVASFRTALTVARLPKTRSGKILRGTIKKIADGADWTAPATIDDPQILGEIKDRLKTRGIGASGEQDTSA